MNEFEKIEEELNVERETEKAIAVKVGDDFKVTKYTDKTIYNLKWIPKSVALIKNNKLIALKGWFIDKECTAFWELVSKEAVERYEQKYCKKAN